jgi:hypothetical protein
MTRSACLLFLSIDRRTRENGGRKPGGGTARPMAGALQPLAAAAANSLLKALSPAAGPDPPPCATPRTHARTLCNRTH